MQTLLIVTCFLQEYHNLKRTKNGLNVTAREPDLERATLHPESAIRIETPKIKYDNTSATLSGSIMHDFLRRAVSSYTSTSMGNEERVLNGVVACDSANNLLPVQKQVCSVNNIKERRYMCNECSYAADHRSKVKRHIASVHIKERPHHCNECDYSSFYKGHLKQHIALVHNKERPYQCSECGYSAGHKGYLKQHIASVHGKEKPHRCDQCDYSTYRKGDLKKHIYSVHERERGYKCADCEFSVGDKKDWAWHRKQVHNDKRPFKCVECNFTASQCSVLKKHIAEIHVSQSLELQLL